MLHAAAQPPPPPQVQQTVTPEQEASSANQLLPIPPVATMSSCPHALITAPFMDKPPIPIPPQLQSDVTIQLFRQWCRKFYSVLIGLHNLPPAPQLTYLHVFRWTFSDYCIILWRYLLIPLSL